jgi:CorA-like Mg2+ transporter protein
MAMLSVEQARIGNRQNATTEQLTILATIFLPLTLTGFFGQNFGWLTGAHHHPGRVRHLRDRRPGGVAGCAAVVTQVPPGRHGYQRGRGNDWQPRPVPRPASSP